MGLLYAILFIFGMIILWSIIEAVDKKVKKIEVATAERKANSPLAKPKKAGVSGGLIIWALIIAAFLAWGFWRSQSMSKHDWDRLEQDDLKQRHWVHGVDR